MGLVTSAENSCLEGVVGWVVESWLHIFKEARLQQIG
jgi:hypothetical protein